MGVRELLQVTAMWFGLGEPVGRDGDVPGERRAAYLLVQTLAAVALGALAAVIFLLVKGEPVPVTWVAPYVPLFLPLAIAVARDPGAAVFPLTFALAAGVPTAVVGLAVDPGHGFWAWFIALSAAALVGGAAFGVAAGRAR